MAVPVLKHLVQLVSRGSSVLRPIPYPGYTKTMGWLAILQQADPSIAETEDPDGERNYTAGDRFDHLNAPVAGSNVSFVYMWAREDNPPDPLTALRAAVAADVVPWFYFLTSTGTPAIRVKQVTDESKYWNLNFGTVSTRPPTQNRSLVFVNVPFVPKSAELLVDASVHLGTSEEQAYRQDLADLIYWRRQYGYEAYKDTALGANREEFVWASVVDQGSASSLVAVTGDDGTELVDNLPANDERALITVRYSLNRLIGEEVIDHLGREWTVNSSQATPDRRFVEYECSRTIREVDA